MIDKTNGKKNQKKDIDSSSQSINVESTDLLKTLLDSIPDFIYIKDKNHRFLIVNKALADSLGEDPSDMIGRTDHEFFPQKNADNYYNDEEFVITTGNPIINKTEIAFYREKEIWVSTTKIPYHDKEGNIIGIMGISSNVTQRVAELEHEKNLFNTLMDNIHEDIYFKDLNSKIVRINKALAKRYGFADPKEAVGMSDADFYSDEHANQAYADEQQIIKTGKPLLDFIEKATYRDREDRWWSSSKMPWYDKNGTIIGTFGIGRDITDKKEADEKIIRLSFHDPLTGLYNRAFFDEELARLDSARQFPLTILMGDVNGLKQINDSLGHLKGDELLKKMAKIFKDCFRKEDIVSRWGGDEFIVILPKTPLEKAIEIEKKIKILCHQYSTEDLRLSISIGVSSKTSVEEDIVLVLEDAETSMYKDKVLTNKTNSQEILRSIKNKLIDSYSEEHGHSTGKLAYYAARIGEKIGLDKAEIGELKLLNNVYNIGRITLLDEIISKYKKLTRKEWEMIKQIPELGYRIAQSSEPLRPIAESILSSFEWYNGKGYPRGIKGEEIPVLARISFLLNSFEAMSVDRPYRKKMSFEEIIEEIRACSGTQFDPEIVKIFLEVLDEENNP